MSRGNVEVVRAAFRALETEGPDALFKFLDPEVEWHVRADLPDADVYRGHAGIRRLLATFDDALEESSYRPQDFIPAGDRVVVPLRWSGRGRGSGVEFEEREETWVFTLRNGMVSRTDEYATKAEALEAAGLSE
jgi:ketosteroid isomerase-like protein